MSLAGYIGAVGQPKNVKASAAEGGKGESEAVAMTAPVITQEVKGGEASEKVAMTAPVLTGELGRLTLVVFLWC